MLAKSRVLVADDDHDIRDLIRAQLESAGYEVHVARDGADALQRISSAQPHAMVLTSTCPNSMASACWKRSRRATPFSP